MKVLIAEDDAVSRLILRRGVERLGHACFVAADGTSAWEQYQEHVPDVVISDWVMPGIEGIELCKRIRAREKDTYAYFVFITSLGDKEHLFSGMEAGADDYMIKPADMDDLRARLIAASRVTGLHRRLIEQNAELERLGKESYDAARRDPLTRVGNRLRMKEDLETMRARVARTTGTFAAALADVDHFKKYNDHHGHAAGDAVLVQVASAMTGAVREGDLVYRYGGEEFAVILPNQTEETAARAMERVRAALEALALPHLGRTPASVVTMSIGVAALAEDDAPPWDALLKRADDALYRAKEAGRNRVVRASK